MILFNKKCVKSLISSKGQFFFFFNLISWDIHNLSYMLIQEKKNTISEKIHVRGFGVQAQADYSCS